MVQKGAPASGNEQKIGTILARVREMVYGSRDARATALAELKETEQGDPFKILIGTILSHRTRDEKTTEAVEALFGRYRNARELSEADEEEVRELIRPVGFYNVKAKSVIRVSKQVVQEFDGRVPDRMEDLLTLHSVGRKTANCVLVYGFETPAIPVDTHVHRISNRLGLVETQTPEETETELTGSIPRRYWLELNELFVRFGQTTCRPVGPRCEGCSLSGSCRYYREVVGRGGRRSAGVTGTRPLSRSGSARGRGPSRASRS